LSDASSVAPPVGQTQLDVDVISCSFSDYVVEVNKSFFVPLIRCETK
jgi:hypothetical protein